jgi:hypothetical protein
MEPRRFEGNINREALPLPPFPPESVTSKLSIYLKRNLSGDFERNLNIGGMK